MPDAATVATPAGDVALLCPYCGYDLRGSKSDRCSECGKPVDRSALQSSVVPWAARRQIGRVRAFWKTVNLFAFDLRKIRSELLKPQREQDARSFRRWNALAVWLALMTIVFAFLSVDGWDGVLPRSIDSSGLLSGFIRGSWTTDVYLPWFAGLTCLPAIPLYLAGLAYYLTGVAEPLHRLKQYPPEHRHAARCLAIYAASPLALLLPAVALTTLGLLTIHGSDELRRTLPHYLAVLPLSIIVISAIIMAAALPCFFHRSALWVVRSYHGGMARYLLALLELIGRSLVGLIMFGYVAPWCVGLWQIMIFAD